MQNADRIFHPHYLISVAAPVLFHRRVASAGSDARATCREIGTALALAPFDVGISVIKTSRIETNAEPLAEESGQFVHGYLPVVDTFHLVQGVYQLDYFDHSSRPTSFTDMRFRWISIAVTIQNFQLRVNISDDDMQETNLSITLRRFLFRDIAA